MGLFDSNSRTSSSVDNSSHTDASTVITTDSRDLSRTNIKQGDIGFTGADTVSVIDSISGLFQQSVRSANVSLSDAINTSKEITGQSLAVAQAGAGNGIALNPNYVIAAVVVIGGLIFFKGK